ncbi:MAG: hypothetical protein COB85_06065 [Bacteroidetes bacterium]|nr:MAG: hypothetical protein COB85_06065 [Bacteroidota bacterium]
MEKIKGNPGLTALVVVVIIAAIFRLIPHPPNFTPIGAMALFGGAYFANKKLAFLIPMAAMLLSDLFIGFHSGMPAIYLSFGMIVLIGIRISNNVKPKTVIVGALGSSVLFFVVTNFAVWMMSAGMYSKDFEGLVTCYVAAIPFFQNTVMGDLVFASTLFGGYYLVKQRFPVLAK